jgi:hypothetical protein
MALFHNLAVKLRDSLCGVRSYASAQSLVFLDLVKNCRFLNRTLSHALFLFLDGHEFVMRVSARGDGAKRLYLVSNTVRESSGGGLQASGRPALFCVDRILGKE